MKKNILIFLLALTAMFFSGCNSNDIQNVKISPEVNDIRNFSCQYHFSADEDEEFTIRGESAKKLFSYLEKAISESDEDAYYLQGGFTGKEENYIFLNFIEKTTSGKGDYGCYYVSDNGYIRYTDAPAINQADFHRVGSDVYSDVYEFVTQITG